MENKERYYFIGSALTMFLCILFFSILLGNIAFYLLFGIGYLIVLDIFLLWERRRKNNGPT